MKLDTKNIKTGLYRRRFLFPNAITLASMFCGFLCIIYSSSGRFDKAALSIGFSILLDGLDGRVARKFNATSKFGVEFDSMSDLVSFGVGPAIAMYNWCFRLEADEFGVFVCFIYALCTAARLARFNIVETNSFGFTGLPSPGAAGVVAALINAFPIPSSGIWFHLLGTLTMLSLAYLMVSKVEYWKIKLAKISGIHISKAHVIGTIALGALIALIWYNAAIGFLALALGYAFSGLLRGIYKKPDQAAKSNV